MPPVAIVAVAAAGLAFGTVGTITAAVAVGATAFGLWLGIGVAPQRDGSPSRPQAATRDFTTHASVQPQSEGKKAARHVGTGPDLPKMRTELREAQLTSARLVNADLRDVDLRHANLRAADLRGANLRGANLEGANLESALLSTLDDKQDDLLTGD